MTTFAICEGSDPDPIGGALIVLAAVVFYVIPVIAVFVTAAPASRWRLFVVYAVAVAISVLFGYVIPGGLSGTGADYLTLFFAGVACGTMFGLTVGFVYPQDLGRSAVLGLLGGGTFLAVAVGGLFFALETSGACFG